MHENYLFSALEQAKYGRGLCSPNPCVGAVAVKDGKIIAQDWHRGAGTKHAERLVIDQLPQNLAGVTLYVTLEPCNHQGRTPPCVDAITNYGFERVVFAYKDPNPLVSKNNTSALLQQCGIDVLHYPIPAVDEFYQSYRYWTVTGKPWVTAKIAQSFDGKIAGLHGKRIQLSNEACQEFTHHNRLMSDIILTSARTINVDDPKLNVRLAETNAQKPVAIIDRQLTLNPHATVFSTASHCHIFYDSTMAKPECLESNRTYHPVDCVNGKVDLHDLMCKLGQLGYHSVWLESGGELFSAMHQAKLVHRTYVILVPSVLGQDAFPAYPSAGVLSQAKTISWMPMNDNVVAVMDWL